jgi:hypothetical protein
MSYAQSLDASDTAGVENAAELALTAFCWWRADVPQEVCEIYWRDVHGIMFARAPGLWQARQLRLAANRPDLWPAVQGISIEVADAAQPQGVGHALFLSEAGLNSFSGHPLPWEVIPNDARNFIGRIGALLSSPGGGRTLSDRINQPAMQGTPPVPTFMLGFVPRAGTASPEQFHRYLSESGARPWSRHPGVMRLREEPLPPYGESAMSSPGVPHQWPSDETYLGWIELAVRDEGLAGELLEGTASDGFAERIAAIHTYPVREVYTIVSAGRPTEVGLRGYPAVQAITAAGADNQRNEAVLKLLYGDVMCGPAVKRW